MIASDRQRDVLLALGRYNPQLHQGVADRAVGRADRFIHDVIGGAREGVEAGRIGLVKAQGREREGRAIVTAVGVQIIMETARAEMAEDRIPRRAVAFAASRNVRRDSPGSALPDSSNNCMLPKIQSVRPPNCYCNLCNVPYNFRPTAMQA